MPTATAMLPASDAAALASTTDSSCFRTVGPTNCEPSLINLNGRADKNKPRTAYQQAANSDAFPRPLLFSCRSHSALNLCSTASTLSGGGRSHMSFCVSGVL
eukprot:GHRR01029985.1.p1 GENE.GHRR01029985.1~~GHRR01029985.1.p1  ORF type:complete len:102 (+),score=13.29 GHRR01029985.1:185-490(+)